MSKWLSPGGALFLLALTGSALAGDAGCGAASGSTRTSLLELYTSEGCSSCPPADRWLSGLLARAPTERRLVPLAFHVDYWNRLGWSDRFSKAAYSARQRWMADVNRARVIHTPQFLLDGRDWRPQRDAMPEAGSGDQAAGELRLALGPVSGERLRVSGEARLDGRVEGVEVFLALYENNLTSRVATGENAGRLLRHDFVVRELVGPFRFPASGHLRLQHDFALGADWKRDDLGVSAFIQNANTGELYQALQRPVCGGSGGG